MELYRQSADKRYAHNTRKMATSLLTGSIINIDVTPTQIITNDIIIMWLVVRGISNTFPGYDNLIVTMESSYAV